MTDFNKAFVLVSLVEKTKDTAGWKPLHVAALKELGKMCAEILDEEKEEAEKGKKEPELWSKDEEKSNGPVVQRRV